MPYGHVIRLARSLTRESKPQQATPANHSSSPIFAASIVRTLPPSTVSAAARVSFVGMPRAPAMSLPVPAGMMPERHSGPRDDLDGQMDQPVPAEGHQRGGVLRDDRTGAFQGVDGGIPHDH